MKNLLTKSDENETSFQSLRRKKRYNSCIHCAYYCAYQLSVYLLRHRFNTTLESLLEAKGKNKPEDSHVMIINELASCIKRYNSEDFSNYREWMKSLKTSRYLADYSTEMITSTTTDEVDLILNKVRNLLKSKYIC